MKPKLKDRTRDIVSHKRLVRDATRHACLRIGRSVIFALAGDEATYGMYTYILAPTHSDRSEVKPSKTPAGKSFLMPDDMSLFCAVCYRVHTDRQASDSEGCTIRKSVFCSSHS